jgi:hypothetical protein
MATYGHVLQDGWEIPSANRNLSTPEEKVTEMFKFILLTALVMLFVMFVLVPIFPIFAGLVVAYGWYGVAGITAGFMIPIVIFSKD